MTKLVTKSGAEVIINLGDAESAFELHDRFLEQIATLKMGIDLSVLKNKGLSNLDVEEVAPLFFEQIVPAFASLASSKPIRSALLKCLERSTYNGERINLNTFSSEAAREDYYEVFVEALKANLRPFGKSLLSALSTTLKMTTLSPQK